MWRVRLSGISWQPSGNSDLCLGMLRWGICYCIIPIHFESDVENVIVHVFYLHFHMVVKCGIRRGGKETAASLGNRMIEGT